MHSNHIAPGCVSRIIHIGVQMNNEHSEQKNTFWHKSSRCDPVYKSATLYGRLINTKNILGPVATVHVVICTSKSDVGNIDSLIVASL